MGWDDVCSVRCIVTLVLSPRNMSVKRKKSDIPKPVETKKTREINGKSLVDYYMATIIAPESTSSLPLLYSTGPTTQKVVPECTFSKIPEDWAQSAGGSTYSTNHRLYGTGNDNTITDAIGQPLQLLHILGDEATQAAMFEVKNTPGFDCPMRWTAPGGTPNFIISAVALATSITSAIPGPNLQTPALFENIMPINANFDATVLDDLFDSIYYNLGANNAANGQPPKTAPTYAFHGPVQPVMKANELNYLYIPGANQVYTNNTDQTTMVDPAAGYVAGASKKLVQAATSSCILISEGDSSAALAKIYPKLSAWLPGDKLTVQYCRFGNNTDGNPVYEATFTIPTTWPPTNGNRLIGVLPTPDSDEIRLRVSVLAVGASGPNQTSNWSIPQRSITIGHTSCGGLLCHRMAPGLDGSTVLSLASASRLWASSLNVKNWTVLSGRGARAVVYKMQKGDFYSEAFGIDAGDPYSRMGSQPDELDETFEKGERFYNTPPCEETENKLRENIDQPTNKLHVAMPQSKMARYPYAIFYSGIDRNLTAQCLVSNGVQQNVATPNGGTQVIVNQQPAQNLDSTWWTRWEFVANGTASQVFYKQLPPNARGLFETAAGRTALMKKAGPSAAGLDFFYKSEGYLMRNAARMGVGMIP